LAYSEPQLTVRRSQRRSIGVEADFEIDPAHALLVRFAPAVSLRDGALPVTAVDLSEGGIGVITTTFLPAKLRGVLRLRNPLGGGSPLFQAAVAVRRSVMTDRRPGYQVGLAYTENDEAFRARLEAFLALIDDAM
jgi:hypothetical protein